MTNTETAQEVTEQIQAVLLQVMTGMEIAPDHIGLIQVEQQLLMIDTAIEQVHTEQIQMALQHLMIGTETEQELIGQTQTEL